MSRYIDADALIERWNNMSVRGRTEFDQEIMLAPTIDAIPIEYINLMNLVEVVRCKECKHRYDDGWLEPRWTCDYLKDMRLKDDDFCSYGVRKTNTTAEEKPTPIRDYMVYGEREGE